MSKETKLINIGLLVRFKDNFETLIGKITGPLSALTTTTKNNLVGAINEVKEEASNDTQVIFKFTDSGGTSQVIDDFALNQSATTEIDLYGLATLDDIYDIFVPVKFTAKQANSTVGLSKISTGQTLEYSTDRGNTWTNMTTATTVTLANSGDSVYVRGVLSSNNTSSNYTQFTMSGDIKASGNINYLWNKDNPNIALKQYCGGYLFRNITALTDVSELELPATTFASYCYTDMFYGCTSLTTAPSILPATTLAQGCYNNMFRGCTSLTTAPELPATTLMFQCYTSMFIGCTNLNYIKCLATNISATLCTTDWVGGVASTGTFVKDASMTGWTTGSNGIPTGWTVQDA